MIGRAVSVLALLVVAGCGGGTGSDHALPDASDVASDVAFDAGADQDAAPDLDALSGPTPTLTVEVDTADVLGEISPALFGANLPWVGLAGRTVDYGDVLRDRSFRTGLNPATRNDCLCTG